MSRNLIWTANQADEPRETKAPTANLIRIITGVPFLEQLSHPLPVPSCPNGLISRRLGAQSTAQLQINGTGLSSSPLASFKKVAACQS